MLIGGGVRCMHERSVWKTLAQASLDTSKWDQPLDKSRTHLWVCYYWKIVKQWSDYNLFSGNRGREIGMHHPRRCLVGPSLWGVVRPSFTPRVVHTNTLTTHLPHHPKTRPKNRRGPFCTIHREEFDITLITNHRTQPAGRCWRRSSVEGTISMQSNEKTPKV